MGKRKAKKTVKQPESSFKKNGNGGEAEDYDVEKYQPFPTEENVERQTTAIRAIRDVEIERLLTELRLLRSYLSKDQLQTPLLAFFKQNFPNLSISASERKGEIEVEWKGESKLCMNPASGLDIHNSFLHRLSIVRPPCSTAVPSLRGFGFSGKSVKTNLSGVENLQISDLVLDELADSFTLGKPDVLQTPSVNNQRLSIGMTPKSIRLPKQGEMLLSVHGSPLGVYRDNNMEAIYESEED